ncbi:hypothetical protein 162310512 [Organic Lake phycodnavirus]|jgi:hypothetical protein|nr:hypothetical protein 162310512 [Organic Lake phycodnavirus]
MSITTLKRKSAAKYGRHSTKNGFSLNNSRRIDAHSNQEQTQTPFRGVDPKGHGGYYGEYKIHINQSQYNNTYDPFDQAQPTTLSNHALLSKKLRPLYSGYPTNVVQPTKEPDYETFVQGKVADLKHNNQQSGTCGTYQKTTGPMDYDTYIATRLKKNKCLAPPKLTFPPRIQRNNVMGCYKNITYEQYKNQQEC